MIEKPILFNAWSVQRILAGKKTQTRRIITNVKGVKEFVTVEGDIVSTQEMLNHRPSNAAFLMVHCPYGRAGDRLWIRETWATVNAYDELKPSAIPKGEVDWPRVWYKATDYHQKEYRQKYFGKWRASIHMPHWASRITLEVISVRVEKVQEITKDNIISEGVEDKWQQASNICHFNAFRDLWDSINAKRGFSWSSNPWVWAVTFSLEEVRR